MRKTRTLVIAFTAPSLLASCLLLAQQTPAPRHPMNFFVTSVPIGEAATSAAWPEPTRTARRWRPRSARAITPGTLTSARRRAPISPPSMRATVSAQGPWYNVKGEMIAHDLAHLHGDTLEQARLGNNVKKLTGLTEKGEIVPGLNDYADPQDNDWDYVKTTPNSNRHEMLTGSQTDGRAFTDNIDHTCNNWTSNKTRSRARRMATSTPPTAGPMPRSVFPTATAAATDRGTLRTERAGAARNPCRTRTASACSTASPSIDKGRGA